MTVMLPHPLPTILLLGPDNAIDLEELGQEALETFIKYDGMAEGDIIIANWFGCGANGEVADKLNNQVEVSLERLTPHGMPIPIENELMQRLRNGTAYYSYRVRKPGGTPGDESLRLFAYIGKRPRAVAALPVPQIRESHDLHLSLVEDEPRIFTPWVAPYQAMATGDTVTLHCRRFNPDGSEYLPALAYPRVVEEGEAGKPLDLFLNRSDLLRVEDGSMQLHYGIQYVGTEQETTLSPQQTFKLLAPASAPLPALEIVGHDGGTLNPALFPEGLRLRIEGYADMEVGDELLCHISSSVTDVDPLVLRASVDASTLDKGFFELHLDADWVAASQGGAIDLRYQYAWIGSALSSTPYLVNVREPLHLPMPIVKDARPDPDNPVEGEGVLNVLQLVRTGVTIDIDPEANYGADDIVQMHWQGFGTGGKYIAAAPTTPGGRTYNIPPQYIPSNLDKPVQVYYSVQQPGEPAPVQSEIFTVRVLPIEKHRYPTIQSAQGQANNGTIYISRIGGEGELFTLRSWPYMREGQVVRAVINGRDGGGAPLAVAIFDDHVVTPAQVQAGEVKTHLARSGFESFQLGGVSVQVTITYEPGAQTLYTPTSFMLSA